MSILVTCYHGTTLESASQILDEGFIPTTGNEDWLGHGIYFFEASVHLGWIYARKAVGRAREKGYSAEPALSRGRDRFDRLHRSLRPQVGSAHS